MLDGRGPADMKVRNGSHSAISLSGRDCVKTQRRGIEEQVRLLRSRCIRFIRLREWFCYPHNRGEFAFLHSLGQLRT